MTHKVSGQNRVILCKRPGGLIIIKILSIGMKTRDWNKTECSGKEISQKFYEKVRRYEFDRLRKVTREEFRTSEIKELEKQKIKFSSFINKPRNNHL